MPSRHTCGTIRNTPCPRNYECVSNPNDPADWGLCCPTKGKCFFLPAHLRRLVAAFDVRICEIYTCTRSDLVGIDVSILAGPFIYDPTLCVNDSESSDDTAYLRRRVSAFDVRMCEKTFL